MILERLRQALATAFAGSDRRVVTLAIARAVDSFGNMFLIVVIPLYIASGLVDVQPLLGVDAPVVGISLTEALLIGVLLSLFGFPSSFGQPFVGRLSDRTGRRRAYILLGLALLAVANGPTLEVTGGGRGDRFHGRVRLISRPHGIERHRRRGGVGRRCARRCNRTRGPGDYFER